MFRRDAAHTSTACEFGEIRSRHKWVLIAGAASGVGLGCAKGFARRGANLVLTDVNLAGLEKAAIAVRTPTLKALTLRCNVGDDASVAA